MSIIYVLILLIYVHVFYADISVGFLKELETDVLVENEYTKFLSLSSNSGLKSMLKLDLNSNINFSTAMQKFNEENIHNVFSTCNFLSKDPMNIYNYDIELRKYDHMYLWCSQIDIHDLCTSRIIYGPSLKSIIYQSKIVDKLRFPLFPVLL